MEDEFTIESTHWENESITDISHLRDIELFIIFSIYNSKDAFDTVTQKLKVADFTFLVTKKIFEYLVFYAKEDNFFGDDSKKIDIAMNIEDTYNISPMTTMKIFNGDLKHYKNILDFDDDKKENNLELDIFEILEFSNKRNEIIDKNTNNNLNNNYVFNIEDQYGWYRAEYYAGIVVSIETSYIFHIPSEFCDVFRNTLDSIIPLIKDDEIDVTLMADENNYINTQEISVKKDSKKIEQINTLIEWANKNNISNIEFPKSRGQLLEYSISKEFHECNLEDIPKELFEIKKESLFLSFLHNKIKTIPSGILSSKCRMLMLCYNEIEEFPKSVYELQDLSTLCLHSNKITLLPNDIDNIKKLRHLSISNNPIKKLPISISNIATLKELDIENTLIDEESLEYLQLENIEKISFDDSLLPYFIKNFHRLKHIDTINLTHSEYKEDDEAINSLNLKYSHKEFMDEKDYQGHGCIALTKSETDDIDMQEIS